MIKLLLQITKFFLSKEECDRNKRILTLLVEAIEILSEEESK